MVKKVEVRTVNYEVTPKNSLVGWKEYLKGTMVCKDHTIEHYREIIFETMTVYEEHFRDYKGNKFYVHCNLVLAY